MQVLSQSVDVCLEHQEYALQRSQRMRIVSLINIEMSFKALQDVLKP